MCGRVACTLAPERLRVLTESQEWIDPKKSYLPSFNAPPTSSLPVLVPQNGRVLQVMHWGLIPSFSESSDMNYSSFNARVETLSQKPMYRRLINRNRCVAVIEGFYEWKSTPGKIKVPYYIQQEDSSLSYLAGLYDCWENPDGEDHKYSFTVITRDSTKDVSWLHTRMPLVLDSSEKVNTWLFGTEEQAKELLEQQSTSTTLGSTLSFVEVSQHVNTVKNNDAKCRKPLAEVKQEALHQFLRPAPKKETPAATGSDVDQKPPSVVQTIKQEKKGTKTQPTLHQFFK